jgi:hypothetical protein
MPNKNCNHCGKYKDEEEFDWRFKSLGIPHKTCKDCMHEFNKTYFEGSAKERYREQVRERKELARKYARDYVIEYLKTHPCESCGESDVRVLEFHHIGDKDMAAGLWFLEDIPLKGSWKRSAVAKFSVQIVTAKLPLRKEVGSKEVGDEEKLQPLR